MPPQPKKPHLLSAGVGSWVGPWTRCIIAVIHSIVGMPSFFAVFFLFFSMGRFLNGDNYHSPLGCITMGMNKGTCIYIYIHVYM